MSRTWWIVIALVVIVPIVVVWSVGGR